MILKCPHCETKYNFPDKEFRTGRKVKCSVCAKVFALEPPKKQAASFDADDSDLDALLGESPPKKSAAPPARGKEPESDDDLFGEEAEPEAPSRPKSGPHRAVAEEFNLADEDEPVKGKSKGKKGRKTSGKSKRGPIIGAGLVLVLLLAAGGLYFFAPDLLFRYLPFLEKKTEAPAPGASVSTDQIKDFSLQDVNQFYVDNEKVGKLFVVQGKVVNKFSTSKELIKIEATLYDRQGAAVLSKSLLCGNTVSLFQLQMLSEQELEAAINNKVGVLTVNTNVAPNGEVPFVVAFYNPPDTVQEFGIKVIEAKDPPKQ